MNEKAIEAAANAMAALEREGWCPSHFDYARAALSALPPLRAREEIARDDTADIRWAVNVLLEQVAARFEANDTWDIWKSDAASLVRSFKHDLSRTAGQEWREPLVEFTRWLCEASFVGSDLNGGDIQDKAEKLGILIKTKYDPAIHGDHEEAEPGEDWYALAPFLAEKQTGDQS